MSAPDRTWDIPQSQPNPAVVPPAQQQAPGSNNMLPYKWPIQSANTGLGPRQPPIPTDWPWGRNGTVQPPEPPIEPPVVPDFYISAPDPSNPLPSYTVGSGQYWYDIPIFTAGSGRTNPVYLTVDGGGSGLFLFFTSIAANGGTNITQTPGLYTITVQARDSSVPPKTTTNRYEFEVLTKPPPPPLSMTDVPNPLPDGYYPDQPYYFDLSPYGSGGTPPYTWGTWGTGWDVTENNVIGGTPSWAGTMDISIQISDSDGNNVDETRTITIVDTGPPQYHRMYDGKKE